MMLVCRRRYFVLKQLLTSRSSSNSKICRVTTLSSSHQKLFKNSGEEQEEEKGRNSKRPLSPHLSIYQPQLTWVMSIGHRLSGAGLSGLIYAFGAACSLNLPALTDNLVWLVGAAPVAVVVAGKAMLAGPFVYHLANGVRHLIWDTGRALTLRGVYASGWAVNIITLLSTGLLSII